jgi:MFS family permease
LYGLVVASDAFAQMIFSPIFGVMSDKLGQVRSVGLICATIFSVGNVMYSLVSLVPEEAAGLHMPRLWFLLFTRFVVGIGTCKSFAKQCNVCQSCFLGISSPSGNSGCVGGISI